MVGRGKGKRVGEISLIRRPRDFWVKTVTRLGVGQLWVLIWLAALATPFLPMFWLLGLTIAAWLSVAALAPQRYHGRRLVAAALLFLVFWALITGLIYWARSDSFRPILNLAAWLAFGLNLMLAKTPLELAVRSGRLSRLFLGRIKGQKLALALALMAHMIPRLLKSALEIRLVLNHRAAQLPLTRRLTLWGRSLIRNTLAQSDELSRALLKRWPW